MHREMIQSSPRFFGHPRRDTVFVVLDEDKPGMAGTTLSYMAGILFKDDADFQNAGACADEDDNDSGAVAGTPPAPSFTDIKLSSRIRTYNSF